MSVGLSSSVCPPLHIDSETLAEGVYIGPPWPDPDNNPTDPCPNGASASPAHLSLVFFASLSAPPSPSLPGRAALPSPPEQQEQTEPMDKNYNVTVRMNHIHYSNITFFLSAHLTVKMYERANNFANANKKHRREARGQQVLVERSHKKFLYVQA